MEEQELDTVLKKFGRVHPQQQSTLFDQFERLSFEIQLNQAILRRSLSESAAVATIPPVAPTPPPTVALDLRSGLKKVATTPFRKAMRKLFRPFVVSKRREMGKSKDATSFRGYCSKRFSNSVRV